MFYRHSEIFFHETKCLLVKKRVANNILTLAFSMPKANLGKQNGERYLGVKEFTFPHHDLVTVYLQKNVESCGDQIIAIISVANFII